eukprot:gene16773-56621_t
MEEDHTMNGVRAAWSAKYTNLFIMFQFPSEFAFLFTQACKARNFAYAALLARMLNVAMHMLYGNMPANPGTKCFKCDGRGHFARDCPTVDQPRRGKSRSRSKRRRGRSHSRGRDGSRGRSKSRGRSGSHHRSHSRSRSKSRRRAGSAPARKMKKEKRQAPPAGMLGQGALDRELDDFVAGRGQRGGRRFGRSRSGSNASGGAPRECRREHCDDAGCWKPDRDSLQRVRRLLEGFADTDLRGVGITLSVAFAVMVCIALSAGW